jgi:hypothetical protein
VVDLKPLTDPIEFSWQSTPQLWTATRESYCGCGECRRGAVGFGKTKEAAAADLIEQEDSQSD